MKSTLLLLSLLCCVSAMTPRLEKGRVNISLQAEFAGKALVLENQLYHTANGDSLYIDALRFYISGLQLCGSRVFKEPDSYHLVDAEGGEPMNIQLKNVPPGRYDSLCFFLGTDSLANVSGALGGDLDPTLGMYWAWNSGYINVKMEGRSRSCNNPQHVFEFHIGGYKAPYQTLRRIVLPLNDFTVTPQSDAYIPLLLELDRFFSRIDLTKNSRIMIPGASASNMADDFQNCFRIKS